MTIFEQNVRLIELSQTNPTAAHGCDMCIKDWARHTGVALRSQMTVEDKIHTLGSLRRILNRQLKDSLGYAGVAVPAELLAKPEE